MVPPLRHGAEGAFNLAAFVHFVGQRFNRAALRFGHEFAQHAAHLLGVALGQFAPVEHPVADVGPQRMHPGGVPNTGLADLQEGAAGRHHREPGGDEIAGEGIQHQIDAAPIGERRNLSGECGAAGVEDMGDAERAQPSAFGFAAGGGEDLGPGATGQLHGRQTDAAGRGMD